MKEKIKKFIKENKGNISLFLITMVMTLVIAIISGSVIAGGCFGTITLLGIDYSSGKVGMMLGDSDRPGILGIVIGLLLALI